MSGFLDVLSSPAAIRLGWALVHFMWQGLIIGAILELVLAVAGRKNASRRYVLCALALSAMPLCLFTTWWTLGETTHPAVASLGSLHEGGAISQTTAPEDVDSRSIVLPALTGIVLHEGWSYRLNPWMPEIVAGWLLGVAVLATRKAGGFYVLWQLHRQGVTVPDDALRHLFGQACERIRLDPHRVQLKISALVCVPLTMGWLRPVVLFPVTLLTGLGATEIELLLAHELAHIRRHDYLVNLVQSVVETLFFYHPVTWWISRRMRQERESACDQMVTAGSFEVTAYARALLRLETIRERQPLLAPSAAGGSLLLRMERLAGEPERAAGWSGTVLIAMIVSAALVFALSTLKLKGKAVATGAAALPASIHHWPVPNFQKTLGYPLTVTGEVLPPTNSAVNNRIDRLTLHELNVTNMPLQDFMREIAKRLKQEHPDTPLMSTELMVPTPDRPYSITYRLDHPASVRQILAEVSRSYPLRFQFRGTPNDFVVFQLSEFEQAFDEKARGTMIRLDLRQASLADSLKAIETASAAQGFEFKIDRGDHLARYASAPYARITLHRKEVSVYDVLCHVLVTGGIQLVMGAGKYMFVPSGGSFPMVDPLAASSVGHASAFTNSAAIRRGQVPAANSLNGIWLSGYVDAAYSVGLPGAADPAFVKPAFNGTVPSAVSTAPLVNQAQGQREGLAAVVDGHAITMADILQVSAKTEALVQERMTGAELDQHIDMVRQNVLHALISRQLMLEYFKKGGGSIPSSFLDDRVADEIKEQYGGDRQKFLQTLAARGETLASNRQELADDAAIQYLHSVKIAEKVWDYYQTHLDLFPADEQLNVTLMTIPFHSDKPGDRERMRKAAERALDQVRHGVDIKSVGKAFPQLFGRASSGWLTKDGEGALFAYPTIWKGIQNLRSGELSGVIEGPWFFAIAKVNQRREPKVPATEQTAQQKIQLIQTESQRLSHEWMEPLRAQAQITYYPPFHAIDFSSGM